MEHLFGLQLCTSIKIDAEAHTLRNDQPLLEAMHVMQQHNGSLEILRFSQHLMIPPKNFKMLDMSHLSLIFSQLSASATLGSFVVGSPSHAIKLAALHLYHDQGSRSPTENAALIAASYGYMIHLILLLPVAV